MEYVLIFVTVVVDLRLLSTGAYGLGRRLLVGTRCARLRRWYTGPHLFWCYGVSPELVPVVSFVQISTIL